MPHSVHARALMSSLEINRQAPHATTTKRMLRHHVWWSSIEECKAHESHESHDRSELDVKSK